MKLSNISTAFHITLFSICSTNSLAAGFDCEKAQTHIETRICADTLLSALDEELSHIYAKHKNILKGEDRSNLIIEQRYWIKEIRNHCSSRECLLAAYDSRLSSFMPTTCPSTTKDYELTERAVASMQKRPPYINTNICTKLHHVVNSAVTSDLIAGFNRSLSALGTTHAITSCHRILEVEQVRTTGYTRSYKSYGAICQVGERQLMLCDYPMVGKFTSTESFSHGTLELADFTLLNCPLGG